ncbi:MAG TPA: replication-relaxation family protein [Candidatus Sulfotelmatobacter sp.]|jgi:hypothetical protein|nr:replication-relaxation family protein [Candidatus Sulfotelmatobacter sp.]
MLLPKTTEKQKEIFMYLYAYRFLTTNHFQKLFNHKDKKRVKEWLKDLKEKGYIHKKETEQSYIDRSKPAIYCLTPKARHLLKKDENCDVLVLDRIYSEKRRTLKFINKCLSIADMYLYLLSRKEPDQELDFFTESELVSYSYFPQELPSAYITITSKNDVERYFLEMYEEYTPAFEMRNRVKKYINYAERGIWEANTNDEPLPSILFICPSKKLKKHIYYYALAKFKKAYAETIDLYLTTWEIIKSGEKNIWEKVEL